MHPYRKVLIILILSAALVSGFTTLQQQETLRVGIYQNLPLIGINEEGKPAGFVTDILEYIAQQSSWELEYTRCDFPTCLSLLEEGQLDLLGAAAYSPDRADKFVFHNESLISNWGVIYTAPGTNVESFSDLDGLQVAALENDIYLEGFLILMDGFRMQPKMVLKPSYQEVTAAVTSGEAEAAILNRFYGNKFSAESRLQKTGLVFQPVELFFAASPELDSNILETLDLQLVQLKSDPDSYYYQALDQTLSGTGPSDLPVWLIWGAAAAGGSGLLFLAATLILRSAIKKRTRSLRESEEKYRRFFRTSRNPVFMTTKDGRWLDVNDATPWFFGYDDKESFLKVPVPEFYAHPEERPDHLQKIELNGFIKDYPVDMRRKDGSIVHTLITTTTIETDQGEILGYQGTISDVTGLRKTRESLETSQERLDFAIQGTGVGLWDWNIQTGEMSVDSRWLKNLGYQQGDLSTSTADEFNKLIHPDDLEHSYQLLAQHFAGDLPRYECEMRMMHNQGYWVWILSRAQVVDFQDDGEPLRMVGTYLDITERVIAKNETREYADQLEALHAVTLSISSSLSFNEILDHLLIQLSKTLDFVSASVFLLEGDHLRLVAVQDHPHAELVLNETFPIENPLFQEMQNTQKPVIIDNAQRDTRFQGWGNTSYVKGWMGVPLVVQGQFIGYITLDSDQVSAFGTAEAKLARIFATQVAQAIENARLYEQIQQYADELEDRISDRTRELSRMVDLMAGREIRMSELKRVIRELRQQLINSGLEPLVDDPLEE